MNYAMVKVAFDDSHPTIEKYLRIYDSPNIDRAHGIEHINVVRNNAGKLADIYSPENKEVIDLAAILHDIGLSIDREKHERIGSKMIRKDKELVNLIGKKDSKVVANAVKQHRASTGKPKSVIEKIISDADRNTSSGLEAIRRAYAYGTKHMPELSQEEQIERSRSHLLEKYGPGGKGRRTYFPETSRVMEKMYNELLDDNSFKGIIMQLKQDEIKKVAFMDTTATPIRMHARATDFITSKIPKSNFGKLSKPGKPKFYKDLKQRNKTKFKHITPKGSLLGK